MPSNRLVTSHEKFTWRLVQPAWCLARVWGSWAKSGASDGRDVDFRDDLKLILSYSNVPFQQGRNEYPACALALIFRTILERGVGDSKRNHPLSPCHARHTRSSLAFSQKNPMRKAPGSIRTLLQMRVRGMVAAPRPSAATMARRISLVFGQQNIVVILRVAVLTLRRTLQACRWSP